ncbi:hypothetical protein [Streptomyces sp. CBMA152]|uniref:hypothetical protein n=1 Tax=Streptomyces sp. CBMA152 TaxID=1896312 RepID=UPI0016612A6A|nr:hypothetical protein [Streptomyces sp. CBMA152]MBD0743645.1 hypothetical protein [Streptomyces sp. CBMA152]
MSDETSRTPVTAADVEHSVRLSVTALRAGLAGDWSVPAGSLDWDCWETVEHLSDDLFAYAVQLGPQQPPLDGDVPYLWEAKRPGGPRNAVHADRAAGPAGLLQTLEASGALLTAMVRTASPDVRAHHTFGISDPEGFAAMGIVETLLHTYDVAQGLGIAWAPPLGLCDRVLARLFREVPADPDRWRVLLWATGRAELADLPHQDSWRWYGEPLSDAARS